MDEWISIIRWIFEPGFPMYADYQFILTLISVSLSDCLSFYLSSSRFHLQVRQGSRWDKYRRGWKAGWGKGFNKGGGVIIYLAKHGYWLWEIPSVFSSYFSWEHYSKKKSKLFVSFDSYVVNAYSITVSGNIFSWLSISIHGYNPVNYQPHYH